MKLSVFVCVLLLAAAPLARSEGVDDGKRDTDKIVIQTPLQNYEQPSLRDYDECQENRQTCLDICAGKAKCEAECPVCPELRDEPLLVQGVNDTSYVPPPQPAVNTTNIIRLTNEIKNIIKNDIQARNQVDVQVHQNVSQVGGRFGLGYNEHGSCCYVVRKQQDCEQEDHCREHSRQRVCGERCQARVMHAKRVVICEKEEPEVCHESLEYVPARRKSKRRRQPQSPNCQYVNRWPFVACSQNLESPREKRSACKRCLLLTYDYVFKKGLPSECAGCFSSNPSPMMIPPISYVPSAIPVYGYNYWPQLVDQNQFEDDGKIIDKGDIIDGSVSDTDDNIGGGWQLKSDKCLSANGEWEACVDGSGDDASDKKPSPPVREEEDYDVPAQRRRRRQSGHKFLRSIYSRRNDP